MFETPPSGIILPDPDYIGASEYRAIHEIIVDLETPEEMIDACYEFILHAQSLIKAIEA